ncbi:MAG: SSU ribosomal protein S9P, small subunit ribosomal protein S9 [Parcubacteria group bacterium GW2011_GWC1_38_6]|nr:MAG: SSU ribosomal protein S9P, small subunit ribosomal protein S9 [Parcubacteria group bacterium GW2011_GWC1_38_6]
MVKSSPTKTKKEAVKVKRVVRKKEVRKTPEVSIKKTKSDDYFEAVGRRKTAIARVRLSIHGEKAFLIGDKSYQQHLPSKELQQIVVSPLEIVGCLDKFRITSKVSGGGFHAQAEALRHGVARALTLFNSAFKKKLKKEGYLTRDSRMRERKKFGLKRARRAPQWAKR